MSNELGQPGLPLLDLAMALNKRYRLRKSEDFARLRQEGRVTRHPVLMISTAPNGLPHNRYGFITPKRLGNAVQRNRIRRLMREAIRDLHQQLIPGYDVAVIARKGAVDASFETVWGAAMQTFRRARLVRNEDPVQL